jgi:PPM family protein phosphatase
VLPVEEAARFLVELANLRGGPDNITVLIVRVGETKDSFVTPPTGFASKVVAAVRRGLKTWNRRVPWPITILLVGFFLAVTFVVFAATGLPGASVFFAAAGVCIAGGVVGLVLHAKQERDAPPEMPEEPVTASIYRQYPVRIDSALVDQYLTSSLQLKEQLEARNWEVDWVGYKAQAEAASRAAAEGDLMTAFRYHCRALGRLAAPFNRNRPKEEAGFRPKWESTET